MKSSLIKKLAVATILASALVLTLLGGCAKEPEAPKVMNFAVPAFDSELFDPILFSSINEQQYIYLTSLVGQDLHNLEVDTRTGLAYKWEVSEDNSVWTFYLREDAKWQDGTPVTAHDVKFSIPRMWSERSRAGRIDLARDPFGGDNADKEVDERIEIIDDYTIRMHLADSYFQFDTLIGEINRNGMIVQKAYAEQYGEDALARGEWGSGAYKLVEHVEGSLIKFEAWKEHPYRQAVYDEWNHLAIPEESTRMAMLKTGTVDVAEFSFERLPELEAAGFDIIKKPTGVLYTIFFTEPYKDPVIAKKSVRRAIMQAIDYESFNEAFFFGAGEYINDAGNVLQVQDPRGVLTYPPIPYDLEAAKATIAREVPEDYVLQYIGVVRGPVKVEYIEAIGAMLDKAGLNVDMKIMDYATLRAKWYDGNLGPGIYLKNGRKYSVYYPSYCLAPENKGRHNVIAVDPITQTVISDVEVHPDIPWEDLATLASQEEIAGRMKTAKSWDEYWDAYAELAKVTIGQIAPGSGFLFTPRIFAARPGVLPEWEVNLGYQGGLNLPELAIYPPEYEDEKYHPEKWEGKR